MAQPLQHPVMPPRRQVVRAPTVAMFSVRADRVNWRYVTDVFWDGGAMIVAPGYSPLDCIRRHVHPISSRAAS